mmetsp:Transcript_152292/g.283744  ORF Transcript_152292/g.283744 Transcript_152292/m.283744 type:complete len:519 (-) Transcript_152292:22-1578(-)
MGQFASAPVELVRVQRRAGSTWRATLAEMQGWRKSHEDAHFCADAPTHAIFGVLDGHGGHEAARSAASHLPDVLGRALGGEAQQSKEALQKAVSGAFVETDAWLRRQVKVGEVDSGSTCVVAGICESANNDEYHCFIANAGDSRGIFVRKHAEGKPEVLASEDHKPGSPEERARIVQAGGFVSGASGGDVPRLDGNLAVSRGFGDFNYKSDSSKSPSTQKVSCVPDLYHKTLSKGDVIVLACDGIFDVLSSEALIERLFRDETADMGERAVQILHECLAAESRDNMTLMVVEIGAVAGSQTEDCNSLLGLEKYHDLKDDSLKELYRAFIEYCAKDSILPEQALQLLEGKVDMGSLLRELAGMLEPLETPAGALRRCRPLRKKRKKQHQPEAGQGEGTRFDRLSEVCDILLTRGIHNVYESRREELEELERQKSGTEAGSETAKIVGERWQYRWTAGEQQGDVFGPFDTQTITSWFSSGFFSVEKPAEFRRCPEQEDVQADSWIPWDSADLKEKFCTPS